MSDETYYTVLNVKETASASEIKTAYRDLIKKVHPDTITNLAPYLKKIAEDKAKDVIEAYTVLSSATKRRDYDRQLAEYRRQTMPPAPPGPKTTPLLLRLPPRVLLDPLVLRLPTRVVLDLKRFAGLDTIGHRS